VQAVYYLAKHYHRSPEQLSNEELKNYLYYLATERKLSASTLNQRVSAFRFLYEVVLHRRIEEVGYLSRYTHRVALSPRRLLELDQQNQTVTFSWKDYAEEAKHKTMRLELREFVRRFCLHLLPERFVKIRHFGFLSNRQRQLRVAQARALLRQIPLPGPSVAAEPKPLKVCPHCGSPWLLLIEIVAPVFAVAPRPLDSS
jgi:hypothetical protein